MFATTSKAANEHEPWNKRLPEEFKSYFNFGFESEEKQEPKYVVRISDSKKVIPKYIFRSDSKMDVYSINDQLNSKVEWSASTHECQSDRRLKCISIMDKRNFLGDRPYIMYQVDQEHPEKNRALHCLMNNSFAVVKDTIYLSNCLNYTASSCKLWNENLVRNQKQFETLQSPICISSLEKEAHDPSCSRALKDLKLRMTLIFSNDFMNKKDLKQSVEALTRGKSTVRLEPSKKILPSDIESYKVDLSSILESKKTCEEYSSFFSKAAIAAPTNQPAPADAKTTQGTGG